MVNSLLLRVNSSLCFYFLSYVVRNFNNSETKIKHQHSSIIISNELSGFLFCFFVFLFPFVCDYRAEPLCRKVFVLVFSLERMGTKSRTKCFYALFFLLVGFQDSVQGRLLLINKPDRKDPAASARWLVSQNSWGVLNTISSDLGGAPFGNVVSFSDGLPGKGSGIPYFYLTTLDPTAKNALQDQRSSFTISEYPLGTCGKKDPENPSCAKITLTGKLKVLKENSKEAEIAKSALFAKHPEMRGWPKGHNFQFFKLDIEDIFLINWFGGPKPLTVDQYLNYKV
ncbi:protein CREG1 isoform X1 [Populus alba x Populus x berolinensis]|nr:protein CREG1 isoform X1 [Populus alba x Populus x berolinensis]